MTIPAATWAARLDPDDPQALLAREGLGLFVRGAPLCARGRRIHGLWEPRLRRIELHGVLDAARTDADLLRTLAHELAHALTSGSKPTRGDVEAFPRAFAEDFLAALAPDAVVRGAAAIRRLAATEPRVDSRAAIAGWGF